MAMAGLLHKLLYPPPPSLLVCAMSDAALLFLSNSALSELRGRHIQYSKFFGWDSNQKKKIKEDDDADAVGSEMVQVKAKVPSRVGMFLAYAPAFLAAVASLVMFAGNGSLRLSLLTSAVSVHFLKRVLEVLFVHKYSGAMLLESTVVISLSYFLFSVISIYSQYLAEGVPEPPTDLKYVGVVLFLMGILGNFYHHYLLSKLRNKDGESYKIPKGGLFGLVICPHYLFEIVDFIGMSFISPTIYTVSFTLGSTMYLMGRSHATKKWYLAKFPNFPKDAKVMIPYVF